MLLNVLEWEQKTCGMATVQLGCLHYWEHIWYSVAC